MSQGACSVASFLSPQLKRLLGYLRPYALRFGLGVILVAFVALAEGAVALMIKLAVDFVLNPAATSSRLPIGTIPLNGRIQWASASSWRRDLGRSPRPA